MTTTMTTTRTWLGCSLALLAPLALAGCPDTGVAPDARIRFDAGPPPPMIDAEPPPPTFDAAPVPTFDAAPAVIDAAPAVIDAAPAVIDAAPAPVEQPPVISRVAWTHTAPCTPGIASAVVVTVTVTDADTPAAMLVFSGSTGGCGPINSNPDTVTCPQAAPYSASVMVTDPDGNSDSQAFTIIPCMNGMAP